MSDDLRNVVQQADEHIKQGEYRAAWELLLPYKDEASARKRLIWLRNKRRASAGQTQKHPATRRTPILLGIVLISIIVLGGFLVLTLQNDDENPEPTSAANLDVTDTNTEGEPTAAPHTAVDEDAATDIPTPATETPVVTEDPQELSLQEQLETWLLELEGVDSVISLDVDIPEGQPPLVYTELVVFPGNNNTAIPDAFIQHLNDSLDTTTYSDFVVIISDGQAVTEYILNIEDETWQETELTSSTLATPQP